VITNKRLINDLLFIYIIYLFIYLFIHFSFFSNNRFITNFAAQAGVPSNVSTTRNVMFTDRGDNDLDVTQTVQLGLIQDAAPITSTATNPDPLQGAYQGNNMEIFDLNQTIERFYTLATETWNTGVGAGSIIDFYDFPDELFYQNYMASVIPHFNMFRAGIRFSVRIASSRFCYGSLMVAFVPDITSELYLNRDGGIFQLSGFPHMIVSASQSEAGILDVPFISPQRFIDTKTFVTGCMGRFIIVVLNELNNIGGETDSVQIIVQAQFLEAEMCLPKDSTQSNKTIVKEARKKSKSQTISDDQEENSVMGGIVKFGAFIKNFADFFETHPEAVAAGAEALSVVGLCKPTTQVMPSVTGLSVTPTFNYGKGAYTGNVFAMDSAESIATRNTVGGVNADEMRLDYIAGTPMLTSSQGFNAGTAGQLIGTTSWDTSVSTGGVQIYVDFLTRCFGFTSGSYKFKVYIIASQMHSARLVFYLATTEASNYEDCYHRIIDVQGDTSFEMTVPYCNNTFSRDTYGGTDTPYNIYCTVLSYSQPTPAVDTPIWVNVYKAGASDFRFGQLLDVCYQPTLSVGPVRTQSNPRKDFAKPFECFHPSMKQFDPADLVYPEEYTTIREIIHRMYPYQIVPGGNIDYTYNGFPVDNVVGLEFWGLLYRFWRGSIRVQYLKSSSAGQVAIKGVTLLRTDLTGIAPAINIPGIDTCFTDKPSLEAEIPWFSYLAYNGTTKVNVPTYATRVADLTENTSFLCKSGGDDFSFLFLCPPPPGMVQFTQLAGGLGYHALENFMEADST
jgi:hypothetical protein